MKWDYFIFSIGLLAQLLFSLRLLIQWLKTEKTQKVQSPVIFWIFSLFASLLLIVYGLLRQDIVIVGGQLVSYYIYIRNLQLQNSWSPIHPLLRHLFLSLPMLVLAYLFYNHQMDQIIHNDDISRNVLVWGGMGQAVFTLRFIYQWLASEKAKVSILPLSFWVISLVGSIMIIVYGIFRQDYVLILGQSFGIIIYSRNTLVYLKNHPEELEGLSNL